MSRGKWEMAKFSSSSSSVIAVHPVKTDRNYYADCANGKWQTSVSHFLSEY